MSEKSSIQKAVFAGGCFWCVEAVYKRLKGVAGVMPGYASGSIKGIPNPSYEYVSSGETPYAEAVQIEFNPKEISFEELLEVFWAAHNPTELNRQGNDIGPQYRSAIFYVSDEQKKAAEDSMDKLQASGKYSERIATVIEPLSAFYPAEESHRDFYDKNRSYGYCRLVIDPKITKLYKNFGGMMKPEYK